MRTFLKVPSLLVVVGAFFLGAPASGTAGPMGSAYPLQDGLSPLVQKVKHYGPPAGKKCLKWARRYSSTHGFGHRRCVQWK